MLQARSASKDADLLVLRHEITVPWCQNPAATLDWADFLCSQAEALLA